MGAEGWGPQVEKSSAIATNGVQRATKENEVEQYQSLEREVGEEKAERNEVS